MAPRPLLLVILFLTASTSATARDLSVAAIIAGLNLAHYHSFSHKHPALPPETAKAPSPSSAPTPINAIQIPPMVAGSLGGIIENLGLPPVKAPDMSMDSNGLGELLKDVSGSMAGPVASPGVISEGNMVVGELLNEIGGGVSPSTAPENGTQPLTDVVANNGEGLGKLLGGIGAPPAAAVKVDSGDQGGDQSSGAPFSINVMQSFAMAALVSIGLSTFLLY